MIRVLVSARSPIVRAGLESIVRDGEGLELAASVESGQLESAFRGAQVDLVLAALDRDLDEVPTGLAALARDVAIVLLAPGPQPALMADAVRAGVRAVLPVESAPAEIVAALAAAAAGLVVLHPQDIASLIAAPSLVERSSEGLDEGLTPREIEVLRLIADGESNKGIAWKLGISEHTVKFHVASVMGKLHASSRTEAVTLGVRRGLILL